MGEKIDLYARPIALVALLILVLVGRKDAIFMTVVSSLFMFIVDTFTGVGTPKENFSSLMISFTAGMFAIFLSVLLFKDKIAENFKVPSAFVISVVSLVLLLMVESLIQPLKYICIATAITSGVDELTFKRFYKIVESKFPQGCEVNKLFGFMLTTSKKLGV